MEKEVVGCGEETGRWVEMCPKGPEGFNLKFGVQSEVYRGVIVIGETHRTESRYLFDTFFVVGYFIPWSTVLSKPKHPTVDK